MPLLDVHFPSRDLLFSSPASSLPLQPARVLLSMIYVDLLCCFSAFSRYSLPLSFLFLDRLEMAKTGESRRGGSLAPGGSGDALGDDQTADVAELRRLLKEKEKSVWDLSDRLLQISTEKDQLEQARETLSSQRKEKETATQKGREGKKKDEGSLEDAYGSGVHTP